MQPGVYSVALYNLWKCAFVENNSKRLPEDLLSVHIVLFLIRRVSPHLLFECTPCLYNGNAFLFGLVQEIK